MTSVLDGIVAAHRATAAADERSLDALLAHAVEMPPPRPFRASLTAATAAGGAGIAVIAEIKRRSPSAGALAPDLDPGCLARSYQAGGATALSVLTDAVYFGGSPDDLQKARAACTLPTLRKDFTVCEADVCDARLMGADAVLLIVAALSDDELVRFRSLGAQLGMAALVEVHSDEELDRGLASGADLIGVNRRNLATFEVDMGLADRLASRIPEEVVTVAESGVRGPDDVAGLAASGYDAVLVGETLVTASDPGSALRALRGA